ncbi:MAG: autotransporter domain-containing protein [Aeromonadaceae bacterium]|nr:autotransporter domain-containing protein [Aeromonadaceae bacterium]
MVRGNSHYGVFLLGLAMASLGQGAHAEDSLLQQQVNAALSLMTFTLTPDVTASNLSINDNSGDGSSGESDLLMTQLGGGATMSDGFPIYLEGNLGFSRYDPQFVISRGEETKTFPAKWNTISASGGVGWDFDLSEHWVIRPIANLSLGTVASDLRIADWVFDHKTAKETAFLENGRLNAYGLGGSLMLDYELFSERHDIDAEIRYSYIHLQSFGSTSEVVQGAADAENLSIYLRRRAPTGLEFLSRPVRYVLEGARTEYFGTQRGLLGFNALNSLGAGLEIDSSQYDILISRTRLVGRYMFGENTAGYSLGLAVSF